MTVGELLQTLREELEKRSIYDLRQIGRAVGVKRPADMNKEPLISSILDIAECKTAPFPRSTKGAPPKSEAFDKDVVALVEKCMKFCGGYKAEYPEEENAEHEFGVHSDYEFDDDEKVYSGVLEFTEKFWFLRTHNFELTSGGDVFVHASFVSRFHLREGDYITCKAKRRKEGECPGATYILSVNGVRPETLGTRAVFENLIPCYPDRRFTLERAGGTLTDRVIDLFSPIGRGQRALIVSPPKAGKTTMLKHIACSLTENYPDAEVIILLIDERPEEVTDIRRTVQGARVVYSTFDKGEHHHIHAASLTLEYAKRLTEAGKDVVVLLDSITRLTRAYNAVTNSGRMLSGGLDPQALIEPRKFFGAARNTQDGGSLTIIATALVDTGSRLDDVIYEEFKAAGNMELVLSRELAERRVFPAIDIKASGARKEELLLSGEELELACKLRQMLGRQLGAEGLYAMINKTKTNAELVSRAGEIG